MLQQNFLNIQNQHCNYMIVSGLSFIWGIYGLADFGNNLSASPPPLLESNMVATSHIGLFNFKFKFTKIK